ncbi:MAG: 1-acyl-sn-glycerol-3-phosphate acyltransferase [Lachnospiraceae bacterium]|nr:1-acyl-sn-glycerol-3-phosphate acyltransferase [Lachnospiraceae bacterium]
METLKKERVRIGDFKRFNMKEPPLRQKHYLRPITWAISYPSKWRHRAKIKKVDMKDVKPPYLLLCNHNAFLDFKIMTAAIFPHRANYVVAIDGFIKRKWLMRLVGCICTRKFTNDLMLVKNMLYAIRQGDIVALYPEARYSLCGTGAVLPESLGKLIKKMNVPVVTLIMNGHHINSPFWNPGNRLVRPVEAELKLLFTPEQLKELEASAINEELAKAFTYDDFKWQKDNQIKITDPFRAKGLHKVLYQCPNCGTEYEMESNLDALWCNQCGKKWTMNYYGELEAEDGESIFAHIPDWYEWERQNVRKEIEKGVYSLKTRAKVYSLPDSWGFQPLGNATLTHDMDGFKLSGSYHGSPYNLEWKPKSLYSCHIEYNYRQKGDCVDLNTSDDTLYIYPQKKNFSVTKIALATEELYKYVMKK